MVKKIIACIAFLFTVSGLSAQSGAQLKQQQKAIQQEIAGLKKMIAAATDNKKAGLEQLAILQRQLLLRQRAIDNIGSQVNAMENDIEQSQTETRLLTQRLDTLKTQYRKSIVYAYKSRNNFEFLQFLFSANGFNDALRRMSFLKTYRMLREQQADSIMHTQLLLQQKMDVLQATRQQKSKTLLEQERQKDLLAAERNEQQVLVQQLTQRETKLLHELAAKQKADRLLRNAILKAIDRENHSIKTSLIVKNNTPAKTVGKPAMPVRKIPDIHTGKAAPDNFEKNKGKLPWPIEKAIVKQGFGLYHVPGTKGITNFNYGLTLITVKDAVVKAVADGTVIDIFDVEGAMAVLVQHGRYYSLYGNLQQVMVHKGDPVMLQQALGKAGVNNSNNGEVEFMILSDKSNVDPAQWLMRQ